jgi:hypothetical protein
MSALQIAVEALESIAFAGMSGSGQESEEGMRDWHARRAWDFIGIAARALPMVRAAAKDALHAGNERQHFICLCPDCTRPRAATAQPEPDMRAVCGALGFDPTNHHNAAKCPYCRPAETAQVEPWMEQEAKYEAQMREEHAAMLPDITDDTPLETGEGDARG